MTNRTSMARQKIHDDFCKTPFDRMGPNGGYIESDMTAQKPNQPRVLMINNENSNFLDQIDEN